MKELLVLFRDLKISRGHLEEMLKTHTTTTLNDLVIVSSTHVIYLLEQFRNGIISLQELLDWVNVVWFSNWYDYQEEYADSIAGVLNQLEEVDEQPDKISIEKIDHYIHALKNNLEI